MKHHYRGHKLSMWLSLIPQMQNPVYNSELSMRHHFFDNDDSIFYDGKKILTTVGPFFLCALKILTQLNRKNS